ncbi:hypothetical protein CEUSTIGMA_g6974.t1 [Chlamydomonas eustigma]|uniref:Uncharacterized protein n=1 Tax=Chlamydomonas eustigma TaxID=1157962 RepID=A0A250X8Y4_9CHLO|nr:hypothetical protein CEUSTIGMA_g6974.t1 [Chlamydomonas eustigma]|eukprot:GAX79533.1 hypothetical protein CEUSTIGMA_g6974.t1 [Chlamydomonas eustigma]
MSYVLCCVLLQDRAPKTKESEFWKRRCAKEEEFSIAGRSIELPWLEAAVHRPRHIPGLASSFTYVDQYPMHITMQPYGSHDKAVERAGSRSNSRNSSPNRMPSPSRLTGTLPSINGTSRSQNSPTHFPQLPSPMARVNAAAAVGSIGSTRLQASPTRLPITTWRVERRPEPVAQDSGSPLSLEDEHLSLQDQQLMNRIREVEDQLTVERSVTESKRKALMAASYRATTAKQAFIWHPREFTTVGVA